MKNESAQNAGFGGRCPHTAKDYYTVYVLKCCDGSHYTGCTGNLEQRMASHARGEVSYTKGRLPIELVTIIGFKERHKAYFFEKYLKSGSGRAFLNKRLV